MTSPQYIALTGFQNNYNLILDPQILAQDLPMDFNPWEYNIDPSLRDSLGPSHDQWNHPIQRWVEQPAKTFFTTEDMPSSYPRRLQMHLPMPYEAQSPMPYPCEIPGHSPSLSHGPMSAYSDSSSSRTDEDYCSEQSNNTRAHDTKSYSRHISAAHYDQPQSWSNKTMLIPSGQVTGHINLREVQRIQDPQEVTYHDDEGYVGSDVKNEFGESLKPQLVLSQSERSPRGDKDEGFEQSLEREDVMENGNHDLSPNDIRVNDEDDNGDSEIEPEISKPQSDEDHDYRPRSTRTRTKPHRFSRAIASSPITKRTKITKFIAPPKSTLHCPAQNCNHTAKDSPSLARHIATAHTRPFVCAFGFAGCRGTFGSKNEWKRHVSSQHLALHYWRCELGQCGQGKSDAANNASSAPRGSEFNRKDLFTQHLRRMHAPFAVKRQNKKSNDWEDRIKELQTECLRTRRQPPTRTMCPVESCSDVFEGRACWDSRMEHVGKHLERAGTGKKSGDTVVDQGRDVYLIEYALRENIIGRSADGEYHLCLSGSPPASIDDDAECEEE